MADADTTHAATPPAPSAPALAPGSPPAGSGRSGAPVGNQNRTLHAMFASGLPKDAGKIPRRLNALRQALEAAVVDRAGQLDLHAAATIATCCRWERHAQLASRWLAKEGVVLSPADRLSFSREVARASSERDKCIRLLGLDRDAAGDKWDRYYAGQISFEEVTGAE